MHAYNVNQSSYDYYHSELDEFDTQTIRFKPESIENLVKLTKFDKRELKLMYRGFKQLCPSGVVKEDKFKLIYAQFFPRGAETNAYARLVFNSFDTQRKQEITFTDFVIGLSVLTRGSIDERLKWIFTLYDINQDGFISKDELVKIVNSVHDLMGRFAMNANSPIPQADQIVEHSNTLQQQQQQQISNKTNYLTQSTTTNSNNFTSSTHPNQLTGSSAAAAIAAAANANLFNQQASQEQQVENLFKKFDLNNDGVITLDEFIEACHKDDNIIKSISVFNTIL